MARLNDFLRLGGMILFDTKDADLGGSAGGTTTPNGRALQRIAMRLDVPPLEPVPADHVLTRTFYLLQDFPGPLDRARRSGPRPRRRRPRSRACRSATSTTA